MPGMRLVCKILPDFFMSAGLPCAGSQASIKMQAWIPRSGSQSPASKKPAVQGQRADGGAGYAGAAPTFLLNTVVLRKIARKTAAINAPIP